MEPTRIQPMISIASGGGTTNRALARGQRHAQRAGSAFGQRVCLRAIRGICCGGIGSVVGYEGRSCERCYAPGVQANLLGQIGGGQMKNRRGQAMTEMVFVIPLLLMLAAGVMSVIYICWQGIKVQQAANLGARIQGQEQVAGGASLQSIADDNGTSSTTGDPDLTKLTPQQLIDFQKSKQSVHVVRSGVYGKIENAIQGLFGSTEREGLSVPLPTYGSVGFSDKVTVQRVISPPSILPMNPIVVQGTAYGGEDPHMYGLVRWGSTNNNGAGKFWADPTNLPNPKQD